MKKKNHQNKIGKWISLFLISSHKLIFSSKCKFEQSTPFSFSRQVVRTSTAFPKFKKHLSGSVLADFSAVTQ